MKIQEYQRLFQWKKGGLPFLFSDIFMGYYKKLDCLIIFSDNVWTNFLPKNIVEKTLDEGLVLFKDAKKFTRYVEDFEKHKKNCFQTLDKIVSRGDITKAELQNILILLTEVFFYYSKTEFFYTDKVFEHSKTNETIKENIVKFGAIKNQGREFLNKIFLGTGSYLDKIIKMLGNKFPVNSRELTSYSCNELVELYDNRRANPDKLNGRKEAFIFQTKEGVVHTQEGENARNLIENLLKGSEEKKGELRGIIANRGTAIGHVKIMSYGFEGFDKLSQLIAEMKKGDVLVAETTSPELMMACKKASAILTDQGGLMSHAAIVSRELGIPCIVAVQNATDFLHDGDLVEVDANNGVVKVLEKAK